MTNDATTKTVNVEFSHSIRDDRDVKINLAEYREWLGLQPDEDFEFDEYEVIEFLKSGPEYEFNITGRYFPLEDFHIEEVSFERDC